MANLLRFVLELATDESARARFRADPDSCIGSLDDVTDPLTGEDVDVAIDVVRTHLASIEGYHEVSRRLDGGSPRGTGVGEAPETAARRHLHAVCASFDATEDTTEELDEGAEVTRPAVWSESSDPPRPQGEPVPLQPPGQSRPLLWAVTGDGAVGGDGAGEPRVDPSHPAVAGELGPGPLGAVPEPDGGFEFDPLELVVLVAGLPDTDIEAGTLATVVALHRDPDIGLRYEVEVADESGRRFLGLVEPDVLGRPD